MRDERIGMVHRTQVIGLLGQALDEGLLTMAQHDARVVAVSGATYASDLLGQVQDLPPRLHWDPRNAAPPTAPNRNAGRTALILGMFSLPMAFCVVGIVPAIAAIVMSTKGSGARGVNPALLGRVLGIISVILSIGALLALIFVRSS
ncbi:DUF1707 domain-containing protein [Amorphoplanes digitatis]|uniref:DUF1707 domain-containing protein n=1 Tax=Actinoplanes digitatis TaxID=1868 RepID=A0A7W7MQF3_9ACTN|nr:DUF1707 domain-containing protein [Actinoplanes digitatis]MBB4762349.1 hypothetical protein [Actinoplanes digitatis]BFE71155.1 hypothetical protein GCM10020092_044560 [Actinoplanes digitatis]GID92529.1 hypothetical protein Adi01nite_19410 [Actinoplanes digitatis]